MYIDIQIHKLIFQRAIVILENLKAYLLRKTLLFTLT